VAHCNDLACTGGDETISTVDSAGDVGTSTSIAIGADGLPVISYSDDANYDLKVAHCNNVTCTSATATTVESGGVVGVYTSIVIGADGLPVISHYDATFGSRALRVTHCSNRFCLPFVRP
jgi:predicted regulator of Ras-like GTPase activity (Roadblock/LC7/MglB family)